MEQEKNFCVQEFDESLPDSMKTEIYKQRRLDMCDRIFESIVLDLKILIDSFENNVIDQDNLVNELARIIKNLQQFSSRGEVRTLIARATAVIIDGITKDINNPESTIGPFPEVKKQNNTVDVEK